MIEIIISRLSSALDFYKRSDFMANYQNHLVDPLWFYDAVEEFKFTYDWFIESRIEKDALFRQVTRYEKKEIKGSLQPSDTNLNINASGGNTQSTKYNFYCMSNYRIKIGDFIFYKGKYLHVDSIHDYDEMGVRTAALTAVNLNNYKDLEESIRYLEGEEIV